MNQEKVRMSGQVRRGGPVGRRTGHLREMRGETRRSLGLTALALVPGAGLTRSRYRLFGWVLLGLFVAAVVALALVVTAKGALNTAVSLAVSQDLLLTVAGLSVVAGLVWIFSIILTHRATEPPDADRALRRGLRLFTALVCLLVAAPVVEVARYAAIQRDVVDTVFVGSEKGPSRRARPPRTRPPTTRGRASAGSTCSSSARMRAATAWERGRTR